MSFTRRTFLIGAGTGVSVLVLAACTGPDPTPTPTPASPSPEPSSAVPAPAKLWRSNWAGDPFARGSVSYVPVGSDPDDQAALRLPIGDRVFFAGEAASDAPGTVSGAIHSGAAAARQVIAVSDAGELVAVVGAGAAGAEAARLLKIFGADVLVVEARDRIGGRIDSRPEGDAGFVELGAWKLAADDEAGLIADVETRPLEGTLSVPTADGFASGGVAEIGTVQETVGAGLAVWASEQTTTDVGMATSVPDSGASAQGGVVGDLPPDVMEALYLEAARLASGAEPADISTWFPPAGIGAASVLPVSALSAVVASRLEDVTLALGTPVVGIAYDDDRASLRLGTGESRRVDRVIVTVPLGVLKSGSIEFDPPLPLSMRSAINSVGFGQVELVRLAFDEPFWTTDAVVWSLVGTDAPITTWINLQPLTGETALLGVAAGDSASTLADLDDQDLISVVRETLAPFAG